MRRDDKTALCKELWGTGKHLYRQGRYVTRKEEKAIAGETKAPRCKGSFFVLSSEREVVVRLKEGAVTWSS